MLEFTLHSWDSENYNIINWALTGISISSFEPVEPISEAEDRTFLPYWVALDVEVNAINGNLLLRGPLGLWLGLIVVFMAIRSWKGEPQRWDG
jgi:hypothetical protein